MPLKRQKFSENKILFLSSLRRGNMMPRLKAGWFSNNCNLLMFFQLNSRDKSQLLAFNSWHYKSTMTFFLLRTNTRELPRGLCREAVRWFSFTPCLALWRSRTWEAAFIARSMTKPHRAPGGALPRLCRQSRAKLRALHLTHCHPNSSVFLLLAAFELFSPWTAAEGSHTWVLH